MSLKRSRRPPPATPGQLLGEALVQQGLITLDQLDWALSRGVRTGARLGRILLSEGLVDRRDLQRALAQIWDAPYVDLLETSVDDALVSLFVPARMAGEGWVPVCRDGGGVLVATAERPTEELRARIRAGLGGTAVRFAVTTDWDVQNALLRVFRDFGVDRPPALPPPSPSARPPRLPVWSALALLAVAGGVVAGLLSATVPTLVALAVAANVAVLVATFRRAARAARARAARRLSRGARPRPPGGDDYELPEYTILVPLRGDPSAVPGLVADLEKLAYPREKLQIMLLMERDDRLTMAAARAVGPTEIIRFVPVPAGEAPSRSALLNIGLAFARGDVTVVYDAVDRPGREQLRAAAAGFAAGGPDTVAVECAGGSRHFRTHALRELGGWGPGDVGADADLWLRAVGAGHRTGRIGSRTGHAPGRPEARVAREVRRIEGDLRAALVHARTPRALLGRAGRRRLLGVLSLLGRAATPLATVALVVLSGAWLVGLAPFPDGWAGAVPIVGVANLVLAGAVALWPRAAAARPAGA